MNDEKNNFPDPVIPGYTRDDVARYEFNKALSDLQAEIGQIVKNADNPYHKSKYADLNALMETVKPLLRKHGFVLVQTVNGAILKTELIHIETGESITETMDLLTKEPNMQQLGSAITYARRYSLLPLLNIETVDDDGNLASGKVKTWDELETVDDFKQAILACVTEKQVNALWYKWKDKFAKESKEYGELTKLSGDVKLKIGNPDMKVEVRQ